MCWWMLLNLLIRLCSISRMNWFDGTNPTSLNFHISVYYVVRVFKTLIVECILRYGWTWLYEHKVSRNGVIYEKFRHSSWTNRYACIRIDFGTAIRNTSLGFKFGNWITHMGKRTHLGYVSKKCNRKFQWFLGRQMVVHCARNRFSSFHNTSLTVLS